jgi:site-specific recombinase XerD
MKKFEQYLQSKNILQSGIKKYISQVERYKTWLDNHKSKSLEYALKSDVLDYLNHLNNLDLSHSRRQNILGILRHYYNYLLQKNSIESNPTNLLKIRGAKRKYLYQILTIEELEQLLDYFYQTYKDDKEGLKHYILLSLCVYHGLYLPESKSIKFEDIDLRKSTIKIHKTHKTAERNIPLNASQIGLFYEFLRTINENDSLIFKSIPRAKKLSDLIIKVYPKFTDFKQIRASIITYWIQSLGLRKAQYYAGHRYISSTEKYLDNDLESLKEDISKFHPLI